MENCNGKPLPLLDNAGNVAGTPDEEDLEFVAQGDQPDFDFTKLIEMKTGTRFYTYRGSLTLDPYCESVIWIVPLEVYPVDHSLVSSKGAKD